MSRKVNAKYQTLRAKLIARGTNLARWAKANGYPVMTVYSAARGDRAGIVSTKIRKQLEDYVA